MFCGFVIFLGKFPCPSQPFPLRPSPPKGQPGVHELMVTRVLVARIVSCGCGLASCAKQGICCSPSFVFMKVLIWVLSAITLAGHGARGSLIIFEKSVRSVKFAGR